MFQCIIFMVLYIYMYKLYLYYKKVKSKNISILNVKIIEYEVWIKIYEVFPNSKV